MGPLPINFIYKIKKMIFAANDVKIKWNIIYILANKILGTK